MKIPLQHSLDTLHITIIIFLLTASSPGTAASQSDFSAERGKALWNQSQTVSGQSRSCSSCHTADPRSEGKHVGTGKAIKPMAPSVNPARFADQKKVDKWFKRNCKWTLGRVCSEQEKGDVIEYMKTL